MTIDTNNDISIVRDVLSAELRELIEPDGSGLQQKSENQSVGSASCSYELDVVSYLKPYG